MDYETALAMVDSAFRAGLTSGLVLGAAALYVAAVAWRWWQERRP